MKPRLLTAVCIVGLLGAFAIDLFTPQLLIAAILLDVPIVLSAFAGSFRFTAMLVVAALIANVVAGYANGLAAGGVWDSVAFANRALAALSIVLVGWLALELHRRAERRGMEAAAMQAVQRERALREASENIRSTLSEELVERAIVREARRLLDATSVAFYRTPGPAGQWTTVESGERPTPIVQSIVARAAENGVVFSLSRSDAIGRLLLDELQSETAVLIPLGRGAVNAGVLVVAFARAVNEQDLQMANSFADAASIALSHAKLFWELAQKNEELARSSRVVRDIVYALSHDLRTPLAAAGLTLRQAKSGAYGPMPAKYAEILEHSIEANDELQRLAETLLLVARYESGERAAVHRPVDLSEVLREVAAQMQSLADSKRIAVRLSLQPAIVNGDAGELRRAFVNLFANAVTWSQDGSTISIEMAVRDGKVVVSFADEGFGVPDDLRGSLFMRFGGERERGAGTGLGLYIVRRIAEAHSGTVSYRPNDPHGSVFSVELPCVSAGVATAAPR